MNGDVTPRRRTADAEGEVVVFLIGMRINRFRAVRGWLPALRAMPRMLRELKGDPSSGLLSYRYVSSGPRDFAVVQYWSSTRQLLEYASAADREHRPAWAEFNRHARNGRGAVGIWHETYAVPAGGYENVYVDMPEYGLGAAHGTAPVTTRGNRAATRLQATTP